jgi:Ras-related protein Rab-23
MQEEDFERELKVLVLGNGAVGKTSIIRRFCKGSFSDESKKTIGVDFLERSMSVDSLGQDVRFMLWDTGKCTSRIIGRLTWCCNSWV